MNNNALREFFLIHLENACERECPATQDAVDRLTAGMVAQSTGNRGRAAMAEVLTSVHFNLLNELLCASDRKSSRSSWSQADILLVTGKSRETWLKLAE